MARYLLRVMCTYRMDGALVPECAASVRRVQLLRGERRGACVCEVGVCVRAKMVVRVLPPT